MEEVVAVAMSMLDKRKGTDKHYGAHRIVTWSKAKSLSYRVDQWNITRFPGIFDPNSSELVIFYRTIFFFFFFLAI
jgi:hypothetical protein